MSTVTSSALTVRSPAKVNWSLHVLGRRDDGFHEIESLVSPVSLYDDVTFTPADAPSLHVSPGETRVPADETNLVLRALRLLADRAGVSTAVACRLTKRIPVGGGLGGGSSNAASTLLGLNRMWGLHWPIDRLSTVAAVLGSDVPFFLCGSSAVIRGRGERVAPCRIPWRGWIVLLLPPIAVSTAEVYAAWRSSGPAVQPGQRDALERFAAGEDGPDLGATAWMQQTFNALEPPALRVCPELGELRAGAETLAARPVRLSGSGSTLFTAFDEEDEAERFAALAARRLRIDTRVVQAVTAPSG